MRGLGKLIKALIEVYFGLVYIQILLIDSINASPLFLLESAEEVNITKDVRAVIGLPFQKAVSLHPTRRTTPRITSIRTTPFVSSSIRTSSQTTRSTSTVTTTLTTTRQTTSNFVVTTFWYPASTSTQNHPTTKTETVKPTSTEGIPTERLMPSSTPVFVPPELVSSVSPKQGDTSRSSINKTSVSEGKSSTQPLVFSSGSSVDNNSHTTTIKATTTIKVVPSSMATSRTIDSNSLSSSHQPSVSDSDWEAFMNMLISRWPEIFGKSTMPTFIPTKSSTKPAQSSTSQKSQLNSESNTQSDKSNLTDRSTISSEITKQSDNTTRFSDLSNERLDTATITPSKVGTTVESSRSEIDGRSDASISQSHFSDYSSSYITTTIENSETSSSNIQYSKVSTSNIKNVGANISYHDTSTTAVTLAHEPTTEGLGLRCGISQVQNQVEIKIVGGEEAYPHTWPWQVALLFHGQLYCGGSLIDEYHIITAAHCVAQDSIHSDPREWTALLGKHDLTVTESTEVKRQISKIDVNPDYNPKTINDDIAIMTLTLPVDLNMSSISPICLPNVTVPAGTVCWATGWGATSGTTGDYPDRLQEVNLTIIDQSLCNSRLWYNGKLTDKMICAGYPQGQKDTCSGDSGGPLSCLVDSHWTLMGVTSFGDGCATPNKPGVYSRVTEFMDWINAIIS